MQRRIAEERRTEIVEAAVRTLGEDGLSFPSYDTIAGHAALSRQLVRHYFPDPEQLMVETCTAVSRAYREALAAELAPLAPKRRAERLLDLVLTRGADPAGETAAGEPEDETGPAARGGAGGEHRHADSRYADPRHPETRTAAARAAAARAEAIRADVSPGGEAGTGIRIDSEPASHRDLAAFEALAVLSLRSDPLREALEAHWHELRGMLAEELARADADLSPAACADVSAVLGALVAGRVRMRPDREAEHGLRRAVTRLIRSYEGEAA